MASPSPPSLPESQPEVGRLDSWKQIAGYLDKNERTVRRWEQTEGLPVHKHVHLQRPSVWAYQHELDEWLEQRRVRPVRLVETAAPGRPQSWFRWEAVLGLAVAMAAVAGWLVFRPAPPAPPSPVPFTSLPGTEYGASFSPDGQQVVFYWGHPDPSKSGIYIKPLHSASDKVTPLVVGPHFNFSPLWSPDGKSIVFLRRTPDEETWLHAIAPSGGPDRRVARITSFRQMTAHTQSMSWGPNGTWLMAGSAERTERYILRISMNGESQVVARTGGQMFSPSVAPDGRSVVFIRRTGAARTGNSEVVLQRLNQEGLPEGESESIYQTPGGTRGIAWTPGGKELLICTDQPGTGWRLLRVPLNGNGATRVGEKDCTSVSVSRPDSSGKALLLYGVSSESGNTRMMHASLDRLELGTPFAPSSRSDAYPSFSPNGDSVAFVSDRSGAQEVWVVRSDGSEATRVTENAKANGKPDWSPDGKFLVYESGKYTPSAAEIAPVAGGSPNRIAVGNQLATYPVWSRDGKYIYYASGLQLLRSLPDGREPLMLIDGQSFVPAGESPDGKNLYFRTISLLNQLFRIPRDAGKTEALDEGLAGRTAAVTTSAVYFIKAKDQAIYRLPFRGGAAQRVGVLPVPNDGGSIVLSMLGFTVSPDDTRIIWATRDLQIDLEMVRGFL